MAQALFTHRSRASSSSSYPYVACQQNNGHEPGERVYSFYCAETKGLWIALGVIAAYVLIVVTISSLYIKKMKRPT